MKDEDLFSMDDAELEKAFKEAKAEFNSPDTEVEETYSADEEETEEQVDEDTEQPTPQPTETEMLRADIDYLAVMTGVSL